jgi:hypothetical protein
MTGRQMLLTFEPDRYSLPMIRRVARLGGDSLDVVAIRGLNGYFKDLGPLTPEAEIAELRKYYATLDVPGALVFSEPSYVKIPDGRRVRQPTPNDQAYRPGGVFVVNRAGIIRRVWGGWEKTMEWRANAAIAKYH